MSTARLHNVKICTARLHQHQDLHFTELDYIEPNYIKLYDYIKLQARFSSSPTSSTKFIAKVYIHVVFRRRR
jgi:hypothetical protein